MIMIRIFSVLLLFSLAFACTPRFQKTLSKNFIATESKFQDHTGFALFDLGKNKTVFEFQANQYFTPASNTKILTFYTGLTILGDSLPAYKYLQSNDSLIIWPLGDPSFLNSKVYTPTKSFNFLRDSRLNFYLSTTQFQSPAFGQGWAWDDYNGYYQPERSPFPLYSNLVTAKLDADTLFIEPARFASQVRRAEPAVRPDFIRDLHSNSFSFYPPLRINNRTFEVPFITSDSLLISLLQDTLKIPVKKVDQALSKEAKILYNTPADSVYKVMMQESDNFLAEQLLLQASALVSDTLAVEPAIRLMQQSYLSDLPDKLVWVDGSGLSRYNLFTPRSVVAVWKKIYEKVPEQRLFSLLAQGGKNGTVRNWYKADSPYIFGKTGTLSNNHSLSGYLITRSGKTLIFSFMNSHYLASTSDIRRNMQNILEYIRDNY